MRSTNPAFCSVNAILATFVLCISQSYGLDDKVKFAVPSEQAQRDASEIVMEVYGRELEEARTPSQRTNIVVDLLKTAAESQRGSAEEHALLRAAMDQAIVTYDVQRVTQAIDRLANVFDVNRVEIWTTAIEAMVASTPPMALCEPIAAITGTTLEDALRAEDFDRASTLSSVNIELARRMRTAAGVKKSMEIPAYIETVRNAYIQSQDAQVTLLSNPGDRAACDALGKYLCFGKHDWERGLSYLLTGSDDVLRTLAELELSPEPASERLGDEWWRYSEGKDPWIQESTRKRAAHWYNIALPKLVGLPRKIAEQRLNMTESSYGPALGRPLSLIQGEWTSIFPSEKFSSRWTGPFPSRSPIDFGAPVLRVTSNPKAHAICVFPANLQNVVVRSQLEIHAGDTAYIELRKDTNRGYSFIVKRTGGWTIGFVKENGFVTQIESDWRQVTSTVRGSIQVQVASLGDKNLLWINGRKVAETLMTQNREAGGIGFGVFNSGDTSFSKIDILWPTDDQSLKLLTGGF